MTVTVSLSGEKPTPLMPTMAPTATAPESMLETAKRWYSNSFLSSKCGKLKVIQIALGLLALIFIIQCRRLDIVEYFFLFVNINSSLLTAIILWDNLTGERLRSLLNLDISVEERYNAIVAVSYYCVSFFEVVCSIGFYHADTKMTAGATGILASIAFAYNWWLLYRERKIAIKVGEFNQEQQVERATVLNV